MGWSGKKNGDLLALVVAPVFEVLITVVGVVVMVLIAAGNRLADLVPLMPSVQVVLSSISLGAVVEIKAEPHAAG
jgi:hypothetical protein